MRPPAVGGVSLQRPSLISKAKELDQHLKSLTVNSIASLMRISPELAVKTQKLIAGWTDDPSQQRPAIDSFLGDIYSGLQVQTWSQQNRQYANKHLRMLSGLYGVLLPLDGIYPYRFEMGYKLPSVKFKNMYEFWGDSVAATLPDKGPIINLAAVEYSKVITKYIDPERIVTPQFLTISAKTGKPTFVVVHAKIARGAFAHWLIVNEVDNADQLQDFGALNYKYAPELSTPAVPTFVCKQFGGLGLSVRLS